MANGTKYPREFEFIDASGSWQRLKVPGGWIVFHTRSVIQYDKLYTSAESMAYVPDPDYSWVLG